MESYSQNTSVQTKKNKTVKKDKKDEVVMRYSPLGTSEMIEITVDDLRDAKQEIVFPDANWDGLIAGEIDVNDIIQELIDKDIIDEGVVKPDNYQLQPIIVMKKNTYTQAHRKAQQKYREKFPDKYCEQQRKLYEEKKKDEEWKKKFNERSRMNNEKYRLKKKQEMLEQGIEIKPRGRPRKNKEKDAIKVYDNKELVEDENGGGNFCVRCHCFVSEDLDAGYCKKCSEAVWKELEESFSESEINNIYLGKNI